MSSATSGAVSPNELRASECDAPVVQALGRAEAERRSGLLKAVADPVRIQLLSIISASSGQEACVCDMTAAVGVSQPTVSHHLKVLTDAGLLTRERRGSWAWFTLDADVLGDLRSFLE